MSNEIREPKQERSIETKNKIIGAGYDLFAEVGYYSTNTVEIAKRAGVSTGIVYGYFKDKRDILLEVLDIYVVKVFEPVLDILNKITEPLDIDGIIPVIIKSAIKAHENNAKIHEALHAMSHTDVDINNKFIALEDEITLRIADKLRALNFNPDTLLERIHLSMNIIQAFSHEYVYDKHNYIDYNNMNVLVTKAIKNIFVQ